MKFLITLIVFTTSLISAQVKGIVVDENDKPIPYVNIWVENENIGTTSQEDGTFILNSDLNKKKIVFSTIGYKKLITYYKEKIVLDREIYFLNEVFVENPKKTKEIEIGGSIKIHHNQLSGNLPWIFAKSFNYEPNYSETPFLNKIIFYSDSEKKGSKIKIRIFEMNDSLPENDLLQEELIFTVKKGLEKNEIDISSFKIKFPKSGIAIGLEWMIIEENNYSFKYKDKTKGIQEYQSYAPSLVVNYSEIENSYKYSSGKWNKSKRLTLNNKEKPWFNKVIVPAINLILTN